MGTDPLLGAGTSWTPLLVIAALWFVIGFACGYEYLRWQVYARTEEGHDPEGPWRL